MVSPEAALTTPGPNVLCETRSPAEKDSASLLRSRLTGALAAPEAPAEERVAVEPVGLPGQEGNPVPVEAGRPALGRAPPVERVRLPKTWPP